jgi:transposase
MPTTYRPYEPDQVMLLPASLQDWLPKGHLAYFINDTVEALDLRAFYARYAGGGARNQPFHPAMMVKVLVYGYATGVFSSRKIERRLHEDLAFRMLAAGNFPKHRTIRDFRALHLQELSELFVQVVKLARELGLVKLGTVAIDGTKLKANASRHKAMSYERMQQAEAELKAQIDALLQRASSTDEAEADEPERTCRPRSSGARRGSRRSWRRANGWSSASARPIPSAGAAPMTTGARGMATATPRAAAISANSGCPRRRRRRTSPIRTAGS